MQQSSFFIGVDPGMKGCFAVINENGVIVSIIRQPLIGKSEDLIGMKRAVDKHDTTKVRLACVEKCFTGPMNRYSAGVLNRIAGIWTGLLIARSIPLQEVRPQDWQSVWIRGKRKGTKPKDEYTRVAQQLWPHVKDLDDNVAAALLLAEFARRTTFQTAPQL